MAHRLLDACDSFLADLELRLAVDDVHSIARRTRTFYFMRARKSVRSLYVSVLQSCDLDSFGMAQSALVVRETAVGGCFRVAAIATCGSGAGLAGFQHENLGVRFLEKEIVGYEGS